MILKYIYLDRQSRFNLIVKKNLYLCTLYTKIKKIKLLDLYVVIVLSFLFLSILSLYFGYTDGDRSFGNSMWSYLILIVSEYYFSSQFFLFDNSYGDRTGYSMATMLAILMFAIVIQFKKSLSRFTFFFGSISYSFYLLPQVLGYLLISQFINRDISSPYAQLITVLLITVISFFVNRYVKMPTNQFGHKYVK